MRNGNGAKVRAILEVDGEARAYAIYRINGDCGDAGPKGVVTVLEVLGLDAAAEQVAVAVAVLTRPHRDRPGLARHRRRTRSRCW